MLFEAVGDVCNLRQRAVRDGPQSTDIAVDQACGGLEHLRGAVGVLDKARCRVDKATIDVGKIARRCIDQLAQLAVRCGETVDQFADIIGKSGFGLLDSSNCFCSPARECIDQCGIFRTKSVGCGMRCFFVVVPAHDRYQRAAARAALPYR